MPLRRGPRFGAAYAATLPSVGSGAPSPSPCRRVGSLPSRHRVEDGGGEEPWTAFTSFCHNVMRQKENDERERRGERQRGRLNAPEVQAIAAGLGDSSRARGSPRRRGRRGHAGDTTR